MLNLLENFYQKGILSARDYHLARLVAQDQANSTLSPQAKALAPLLMALVSFVLARGFSCLVLGDRTLPDLLEETFQLDDAAKRQLSPDDLHALQAKIEHCPPQAWANALATHPAVSFGERVAPLVFAENRLYFQRYWQLEAEIARYFSQAQPMTREAVCYEAVREALDAVYPAETSAANPATQGQKLAVASALAHPYALISGGPGTGKTYTVVRLLYALQHYHQRQNPNKPLLRIGLAAPTGKAAARLKESIWASLNQLEMSEAIRASFPEQAFTLHRLLSVNPISGQAKKNARDPLDVDVLVVDEASMIDINLFAQLLRALRPKTHYLTPTKLILLGDKDQLPSVDAGNLMAELSSFIDVAACSPAQCDYLRAVAGVALEAKPNALPISDAISHLRHSTRFDAKSGIGELASLVNAGEAKASWALLTAQRFSDLTLAEYAYYADETERLSAAQAQILAEAERHYQRYFRLVKRLVTRVNTKLRGGTTLSVRHHQRYVDRLFRYFNAVRFLTPLRVSALGVETLNELMAKHFKTKHFVQFKTTREAYVGKAILITENSNAVHLSNGDVGLILPDVNGNPRAYFETDKSKGIAPSRLPPNEPAYIMTVHKSQGSEFAHTLLVMPQSASAVLNKALIYTAITRAKSQFTLFASNRIWAQAVSRDAARQSGLAQQIRKLYA